jgi:hypothetical protein
MVFHESTIFLNTDMCTFCSHSFSYSVKFYVKLITDLKQYFSFLLADILK